MTIPENTVRSPVRASTSTTANWLVAPATVRAALMSTPSPIRLSRDTRAELVVAEAADVAGAPAEARAGHQRRRGLAARHPRNALETLFAVAHRELSDDRQQIDAVEPEPDHVERACAPGRNREGEYARAFDATS